MNDLGSIAFIWFDIRKTSKKYKRDKLIIFVADKYITRMDRLAYGLDYLGFNIILLCKKSRYFGSFYNEIIEYRSPWKAVWIIKRLNASVIHTFSNWNFDTSYAIIRSKLSNTKVVLDNYDVLSGLVKKDFLTTNFPMQQEKEKYCMENADGLCCRSLESQYAKRELNFKFKGKRIFFPEYVWELPIDSNNERDRFENTIVYIGNLSKSIFELAKILKEFNWDLHAYCAFNISILKNNSYSNLKIFGPVKPKEIIKVLRKYKYGIQLPSVLLNSHLFTKYKYFYAAAGKIFDYIEAGLKVFISDELFQKWILCRYGHAIKLEEADALDDIKKKIINFDAFNKVLIDQSIVDKSSITIKKQVERLRRFYLSI